MLTQISFKLLLTTPQLLTLFQTMMILQLKSLPTQTLLELLVTPHQLLTLLMPILTLLQLLLTTLKLLKSLLTTLQLLMSLPQTQML